MTTRFNIRIFQSPRAKFLCERLLHGVAACDRRATTATQTWGTDRKIFLYQGLQSCIVDGCLKLENGEQHKRNIFFISLLLKSELERPELTGCQVFTNCTIEENHKVCDIRISFYAHL